ncbi:MAG TPA: hypothetical protein PKY88_08720 [Anaerohalosphaeraceae bacterium]|nr:hypothetical protein [Anaerohalosphaeraceae bacterium]
MQKTQWFLTAILIIVGLGCVPSLHELYTDDTVVFDPKLVGCWQTEKGELWCFTRRANTSSYDLTIVEESEKRSYMTAYLVEIGPHRFLDISPKELKRPDLGGWQEYHLQPVHTFYLVEATEPNLLLAAMMPEAMEKLLEEKPALLKHEKVDDRLILTASTPQLQEFLSKPEMVDQVFGDAAPLKPYKTSSPEEKGQPN